MSSHGKTATGAGTRAVMTGADKLRASYRDGFHATVYDVRRDPDLDNKDIIRDKNVAVFPFVSGSNYKGQWVADRKHGFGTEVSPDGTKYEGEWADNKRHGRGTFFIKRGKKFIRQYVGDWAQGCMEGFGVYYYPNGEIYRGDWKASKRSGNGRLELTNGDYYVGEWSGDLQHGMGTYFVKNGNVYEGLWMNGMKEGSGKFFYASTTKVYEGEWAEDQPRCGEYREPTHDEEARFCESGVRKQQFGLPELTLVDSQEVLGLATAAVRSENAERRGIASAYMSPEALAEAKKVFAALASEASKDGTTIPFAQVLHVLYALGVSVFSAQNVEDLRNELELPLDQPLRYSECVDIGQLILSQQMQ